MGNISERKGAAMTERDPLRIVPMEGQLQGRGLAALD
jgi:hypothetical protein